MQNDRSIYYDIAKSIRTTDEQVVFLNAVDEILKLLYTNNPLAAESITNVFGPQSGATVLGVLHAQQIDLNNRSQVKEYFTGLRDCITNAEIIHATLAIIPDEQVMTMLGDWLQQTFPGQVMVIAVTHNLSIVGGMQLDYKGKYWDYSLQNQVVKIFRDKKDQLFKPN